MHPVIPAKSSRIFKCHEDDEIGSNINGTTKGHGNTNQTSALPHLSSQYEENECSAFNVKVQAHPKENTSNMKTGHFLSHLERYITKAFH